MTTRRTIGAPWRAAPNQAAIHLSDSFAERPELHVVVSAYQLDGAWDEAQLHERFRSLVRRHPALDTRVVEDGDGLFLAPALAEPQWRTEDVSAEAGLGTGTESGPAVGPDDRARRIRAEAIRPLDTARGPLLRGALLRRADGTADLVLTASHLVVDDRAMESIVHELLTGEQADEVGDYPAWAGQAAQAALSGAERATRRREELAALDPVGEPSWGDGDSTAGEADGAQIEFAVDADLWQRVTALAASAGVTRHSLLVATAALAWSRNGGGAAALVGTFVSSRPARERDTIGYFTSTVPVGVRIDEGDSARDYLRTAQQAAFRAYRGADLPLSEVLPTPGGLPGTTVLNLAVAQSWQPPKLRLPGLTATPHPYPDLGVSKFPLLCYLDLEASEEARGSIQYRRRWFSEAAARLFTRQLLCVLEDFTNAPQAPLHTMNTIAAEDRTHVLAMASGAELAVAEITVPELLRERAAHDPDRIAVVDTASALGYGELDALSDQLAHVLIEHGVLPGDRVGVRMDRSAAQVAALAAVMKAGAAYVPLDPRYPQARLSHLVQHAGIRVVVGDTDLPPAGAELPGHWVAAHAVPRDPETRLPRVGPDDPAYVIHTSGSTGAPKGVVVNHRNVLALLAATQEEFGLSSSDVWSFFHSYAFDFSVWEIWGCLLTGGRLVVVPHSVSRNPEEFHQLLLDEEVTVLSQTPTAFSLLTATEAEAGDDDQSPASVTKLEPRSELAVRLLVFGGEPLDPRILTAWFDRHPKARVENMYGITETTVHCTTQTLERGDSRVGGSSVGRPLPGWELYVLDPHGRLAAPGVAGEIHVGGAGVAQGYLNQPELTARRFRANGHPAGPTGRLYRSGDLGRYLPDGTLEHLGRIDAQVQVRGFRIELGEVRSVLLDDPAVSSAAVVVGQAGTPEARLDAYVVASGKEPTDIVRRAAHRLPEHMIPQTVTFLAALPTTVNGKLDTAALPPPGSPRGGPTDRMSGPETGDGSATLDRVIAIWQSVLEVPVSAGDKFYGVGGTSLLALRLKSALRDAGLPELTLREIVRNATPAAMATLMDTRIGTGSTR